LAGTETLPVVQSSATKQVSVANLTAGRAVSAASLALTTSPLPATSGGTGSNSAFTGNGVVYASSSSALTTGSALSFDGTNLGIGTSSPAAKLDVSGGQSNQLIVRGTNTNTVYSVLSAYDDDSNGGKSAWGSNAYVNTVYANTLSRFNTANSGWAIIGYNTNATYESYSTLTFNYVSVAGATTERTRIDYSGNLLVGTTSASGSSTNTASVVSGVFSTASGTASSIASGTATTIFTVPSGKTNWVYIVSADIGSGAPTVYSCVYLVTSDAGVLRATALQAATLNVVSVSSTNIQVTQNSGAAASVNWTVTRVS
jgi:hypothetical protein